MRSLDGTLTFAATDLSNLLACPHLTLLNRRTALGGPKPRTFDDPGLEVLRRRGQEHGRQELEHLRAAGPGTVEVIQPAPDETGGADRYARLAAATVAAMRAGKDVIYQACLFDGTWLGFADFLKRVVVSPGRRCVEHRQGPRTGDRRMNTLESVGPPRAPARHQPT